MELVENKRDRQYSIDSKFHGFTKMGGAIEMIKFLVKIVRGYWKITQPLTLGARALIIRDNTVLLLRTSYDRGWYLPGGGVKRKETFQQAIRRELHEECNLRSNRLELWNVFFSHMEGKRDYIALFIIRDFEIVSMVPMDKEITQIAFHSIYDLPKDVSPATRRRIEEYLTSNKETEVW